MLKTIIQASVVLALLTGTAAAQFMPSLPLGGQDKPPPTTEEIEKQKALDRAYKSATGKIPDKKATVDPWGGIRSPSPSAGSK